MKKTKLQFNLVFRPEPEGGFTVIVPSLPGCITYGKNLNEARKMAADAISGYLISLKKHGETVLSDEENFFGLITLPAKKSPVYA